MCAEPYLQQAVCAGLEAGVHRDAGRPAARGPAAEGESRFRLGKPRQHIACESFRTGVISHTCRCCGELPRETRRDARGARPFHANGRRDSRGRFPMAGCMCGSRCRCDSTPRAPGRCSMRALEAGVLYVPGEYCFQPDERRRCRGISLRLSFGQVAPDQIEPGIERLAVGRRGSLRSQIANRKSPIPAGAS